MDITYKTRIEHQTDYAINPNRLAAALSRIYVQMMHFSNPYPHALCTSLKELGTYR
jgi:hypothetical protein